MRLDLGPVAGVIGNIQANEVLKKILGIVARDDDLSNFIAAYRACEEFFRQGDRERSLGLPIAMPICDRQNITVAKVRKTIIGVIFLLPIGNKLGFVSMLYSIIYRRIDFYFS